MKFFMNGRLLFTVPYAATLQLQHNTYQRCWVPNGDEINCHRGFRFQTKQILVISRRCLFVWFFCARMPAKKCSKFNNARAKLSFCQLVLLHRHVLVARRGRGPLPCRRVIIPMTLTKMSMRAHARRRGVLSSTGVFKVVVVVAVFTVSIWYVMCSQKVIADDIF